LKDDENKLKMGKMSKKEEMGIEKSDKEL